MTGLSGPDWKRATRKGAFARARTERGSTLVEILMATAIMGTAVVALLTATTTLFGSSSLNRQETTAGIVARDYAEALNVAVNGNWCSASYTVPYSEPGFTITPSFGPCPAAAEAQFQTVTITITTASGVTETVNTVVRKP